MKKLAGCLLMVLLLASGGCMESASLLTLEKDGSGTIVLREFYSPQFTSMLDGMDGMVQGMAGAMGDMMPADSPPPTMPASVKDSFFKDVANQKLAGFGPAVKLAKSKEVTNKKGWKGYVATYQFEDINKVTMGIGDLDMPEQGVSTDAGKKSAYTFEFTPGDTATLKIVPVPRQAAEAEPGLMTDPENGGDNPFEGSDMEGMPDMGADMMAGMMGPMLQGMRMSFFLRINGEVIETNSRYRSEKNPSAITVMDMPVDKMMGNAEAMKLLTANEPDAMSKLLALHIPGVKVEEEDKTISVTFR